MHNLALLPPLRRAGKSLYSSAFPDVDIQLNTLPNGLKCVAITGPKVKKYFGACINTPALSKMGEQHILEHLIVRGSKAFPDPYGYSGLHACSDNSPGACTYHNSTWYYGSSLTDHGILHTSRYLLDGMFHPLLTKDGFRGESFKQVSELSKNNRSILNYPAGVVFNEMRQSYVLPSNLALRNAVEAFFPEFLPQIDFGGEPQEIQKLKYEQLQSYHKRFYFPENGIYFAAHPTNPESIIELIANLPTTGRKNDFLAPYINYKKVPKLQSIEFEVSELHNADSSSLVMFYPIKKPESLTELVFDDLLFNSLFYFDRNQYTQLFNAMSLKGRCCMSWCGRISLGQQHLIAIQVDGLSEDDLYPISEAIGSYRDIRSTSVAKSGYLSALAAARHGYAPTNADPVDYIFQQLTAENWTLPKLNMLSIGDTARKLYAEADHSFDAFLNHVRSRFEPIPFVFTQSPMKTKKKVRTNKSLAKVKVESNQESRPTVDVPSYNLILKKLIKEFSPVNTVSYPFGVEAYDRIISTPVKDQNRIHLNIGFDLSFLPQRLWTHAVTLLETFAENQASFQNASHSNLRFHELSCGPSKMVYPIKQESTHFFVALSVFPDDFKRLIDLLSKVFQWTDLQHGIYTHGLDYQRDSFYGDIFNPSASESLTDAFLTRLLAPIDQGYRHREAVAGFSTIPHLNRYIAKYSKGSFKQSNARLYSAGVYLFSRSAMTFQYSAPSQYEDSCAESLRHLWNSTRSWDKQYYYPTTLSIPRNDLIVAQTETNVTARAFSLKDDYDPAFEVAMTYLSGYVISHQLCGKRGFYRDFSRTSPTAKALLFISQRGSSPVAPFKVYDLFPKELQRVDLSYRQLRGLKLGTLKKHFGRFSESDPNSQMLKMLRYHNFGLDTNELAYYCEGILSARISTFRHLAEILDEKRGSSRNLILTSKEGEQQVRTHLKGMHFSKALVCNL